MNVRLFLPVLFGLVVALAGACGQKPPVTPGPSPTAEVTGPAPGQPAPPFALPALESGQEVRFPEDFRGKKTILLFFSPG
jgi:hypothetical protein